MTEKIFLSAVSGQFRQCRQELRSDLVAVGAEVVVQEDFQQHGGTLLQKLEEYISSCDRVIVLVGSAYGCEPEPAALPLGTPERSYTEWEYYFARGERLDGISVPVKPAYVYFAKPEFIKAHPVDETDQQAQRQQAFIDAIKACGKDRNEFGSINQLARLVLRDGFSLRNSQRYTLQNLPYDSIADLFKGRKDVLVQLHTRFTDTMDGATTIIAKQLIHGLGGVGKTRLAVEYAWTYLAEYRACLFVHASTPEDLERNLAGLCRPLLMNLPEQEASMQERQVSAVLRWLNENPSWLLVLDNVDSDEAVAAVEQLLPQLQGGQVLITSRKTSWNGGLSALALDSLSEDDAVDFLLDKTQQKRSHRDDDAGSARELAKLMGGLALALEQAGAFINKYRLCIPVYLERWRQKEAKLRNWHDPLSNNYPRSLEVTWNTSFDQLSLAGRSLLNLLSMFSPAPIPRELFDIGFTRETLNPLLHSSLGIPEETNPVDLEDLLAELDSLSLLRWEVGNQNFIIHRLVQDITRTRLNEVEYRKGLEITFNLIKRAEPRIPLDLPLSEGVSQFRSETLVPSDVRTWTFWEPLLPHTEQLAQFADKARMLEHASWLMNQLGLYLHAKSSLNEAEGYLRRASALVEKHFGSEHSEVASTISNLALVLIDLAQFEEAEQLTRKALDIDAKAYGDTHPNVAIRLNNLAGHLTADRKYEEAETLRKKALQIDEKFYGEANTNVSRDLSNLGLLLYQLRRFSEAEPLLLRALEINGTVLDNDHPEIARVLNNLAALLQDTNRIEEAESMLRRALSIDEASYGKTHPLVANDLTYLGGLLFKTGRFTEAEQLMQHALQIDEVIYGPEHPKTSRDLNNLALLLKTTNQSENAERLLKRSLEIDEKIYGKDSIQVADRLNNLASMLRDLHRLGEAESLMRRALSIFEVTLGKEHQQVGTQLNNLAQLLHDIGQVTEAESLLRRSLMIGKGVTETSI